MDSFRCIIAATLFPSSFVNTNFFSYFHNLNAKYVFFTSAVGFHAGGGKGVIDRVRVE